MRKNSFVHHEKSLTDYDRTRVGVRILRRGVVTESPTP